MKIKITFLVFVLVVLLMSLQFLTDRIARIIPNYVGFLSFSQGEFMAYNGIFISGNVGPISIGMTEQQIDTTYKKNNVLFFKFSGKIFEKDNFTSTNDPNKKIYLIEDKILNVRYELYFKENKLKIIKLSSRLISK